MGERSRYLLQPRAGSYQLVHGVRPKTLFMLMETSRTPHHGECLHMCTVDAEEVAGVEIVLSRNVPNVRAVLASWALHSRESLGRAPSRSKPLWQAVAGRRRRRWAARRGRGGGVVLCCSCCLLGIWTLFPRAPCSGSHLPLCVATVHGSFWTNFVHFIILYEKSGLGSPCSSHLEIWNYFYEQYLAVTACVSLRCFWEKFTYFIVLVVTASLRSSHLKIWTLFLLAVTWRWDGVCGGFDAFFELFRIVPELSASFWSPRWRRVLCHRGLPCTIHRTLLT